MAGGRRPSNYNPTLRSSGLPNGHNLQPQASVAYWPSSIWQLPDLSSTPPPSTPAPAPAPVTPLQSPTSQLAQALDSAVQAAVIRALDVVSTGHTNARVTEEDNASSSDCSSTRSVLQDEALLARLKTAIDANAALRARADASDARADALEKRIAELESALKEMSLARVEDGNRVEQLGRRVAEQAAVQNAMKESMHGLKSGTRAERTRLDRVTSDLRRTESAEAALTQQLSVLSERVGKAEGELDVLRRSRAEDRQDKCSIVRCEKLVEEKARALRGKTKKIESRIESHIKTAEENDALQSGIVDAMKAGVEEVRGNVGSLKKLVESNLRAHASAESVVKEQVSVITRHVCAAMRAYTSRRLEDNSVEILTKVKQLVQGSNSSAPVNVECEPNVVK